MRSARRLLHVRGRRESGEFLAEGRQAVGEALGLPGSVVQVLVAQSAGDRHRHLLDQARSAGVVVAAAPDRAVAELSGTVTPQGLVAVCRDLDVPWPDTLVGRPRLVVLCDEVRDPGNLGTVVRCADAFGADAVWVSTDSVELYNPKTVRATTGSLFHLPVAIAVDPEPALAAARTAGLQVLGTSGEAVDALDDLARAGALARPTLWVLGNEARGLGAARAAATDRLVRLPRYGRAESLNLSTATAVFLYASATAQRRPA